MRTVLYEYWILGRVNNLALLWRHGQHKFTAVFRCSMCNCLNLHWRVYPAHLSRKLFPFLASPSAIANYSGGRKLVRFLLLLLLLLSQFQKTFCRLQILNSEFSMKIFLHSLIRSLVLRSLRKFLRFPFHSFGLVFHFRHFLLGKKLKRKLVSFQCSSLVWSYIHTGRERKRERESERDSLLWCLLHFRWVQLFVYSLQISFGAFFSLSPAFVTFLSLRCLHLFMCATYFKFISTM